MRIPFSLFAAGAFGLAMASTGCQDTGTSGPLEPAFATASSSAAGGALVVRFNTTSFIVHLDAERRLLALHTPSTICGDGSLSIVQVKRVTTPSDVGGTHAQVKSADEAVAVYHASSFDEAGITSDIETAGFGNLTDVDAFCAFIEGDARIAEGTVRRVSTFSPASFSVHWTGKIQGVGGDDYHLTEVYQLGADAHDPNDPDTFVEHVSTIKLMGG